jgi:hypothetical protein
MSKEHYTALQYLYMHFMLLVSLLIGWQLISCKIIESEKLLNLQ